MIENFISRSCGVGTNKQCGYNTQKRAIYGHFLEVSVRAIVLENVG
jgi:hypothetical protein